MIRLIFAYPFPPVYVRDVWNHSKVNTENINEAISKFKSNGNFYNLSVDRKVKILHETLLDTFPNYIPQQKKVNVSIARLG